ncbi:efflux RND transporter permease subunit [Stenotrophomonas indicatrix]|uniref:efflux RND transporter permease subunit n=1 Tax=Stenotrophomonas TaxID=40323 RepID=UPI001C967044|nr:MULTISPECIES: efflux RND transporter permease subunit [Stenotrophomonas]MDN8646110.1 efflux RND transporter permease subunit [Stenotrophomonas indicatrix]MDN8657371.1 efflux RND transporter permease subunit [Stenotrophomonas indicatrix]QZN79820.1 efflux RND transporter permease subunit [Stenotrophomonas sp. DR822]
MNLSGPFIRRPIGTALLAIGLFMVGVICYLRLGVSALPNIEIPVIFVHASQSGADAATMASTVTAPLERHLGQLPGIDRMRSSSSEGSSLVFMIFQSDRDIDSAALDVQTAINSAQADLPSGMGSPMYQKANPNDDPVIAIALTSQTQSADELYNVADSLLAQRIRQIGGVASVDIAGASTPAVRVDVNLRLMNALGLTADDLRNAVRAANVTSPTGFLSDGNTTTAIIANDSVARAADFADLVVKTQGDGRVIRLKDVANVYDGQQDAYQAAWFDHKPAVVMYVFTRAGANIVETVDRVKAQIPALRDYLQPGTTMTPYFDRTPTIRSSLHEVQITLLISLAMVVLTMALFLRRLAPTLIAAVTVPLSLAGAALVMYVMGFTLNNLSLLALVIAIGFVVDDAIVVIENIMRHLDEGMPRMQAAFAGAREIGFTIVSITASLVAVFIPLLFASGMMGAFFREFTVTLVAAIVVSMIVSLTLTPALCSRFLSAHDHTAAPSRFGRWLDAGHERMLRIYTVFLDFSLRHALLLSLTPLILIGVTIFLFGAVKKGAFPPQDTGLIWGRANSSATVSFEDMVSRQRRITDMLMADPAVKTVGVRLGSGRQGSSAQFNVELKSRKEGRRETTAHALARLSAKADRYPDLQLRLRAIQDLPSNDGGGNSQGAQYRVSLQGNDLAALQEWLPKLQAALKKNPKLRDVGTDVDNAGLRQNIEIDRAKAARLGISVGAIDGALYGAFGQRQISTIYSDINQYSVVVNALPSQTATPSALDEVHVRARNGEMVPITAVARQAPGLAPSQITHENQYTTMDLSYNLAPGVSMGEAKAIIDSTVAGMRMPGDIRLADDAGFGFNSDPSDMLILVLAAILTVYLVLGILYESLIHPVTILSTLPAAGVGALLALFGTNTELSVISMIALVLLIGIVKKNAIMMIDFALVAQREHGLTPREAAREASIVRFRPIMMTTMVAILAAVPLAIGLGEGSELRRPLGIAMIGGLLFSQSLTLLSTPALYVIFSCLAERWKARRARRREAKLLRRAQRA